MNLGWVIFRSSNLIEAGNYISSMFFFNAYGFFSKYAALLLSKNFIVLIIAIIFSMPIAKKVNFKLIEGRKYANVVNIIYPVVIIVLFAISVIFIVTGHTGDFIHFNF